MIGKRTLAALAAAAAAAALAGPASAAGPIDPERYISTPTGWAWHFAKTKPEIDVYAAANDLRVVDVEIVSTNPMKYAAAYVHNSGNYARTSGWYTNQTKASLKGKLAGKRILDLETYTVNGNRRYAAVWVANTGSSSKKWQWWLNRTPAQIAEKISAFNGRIVDIDRVSSGRYNVILLKNAGKDAKLAWRYYNISAATIRTELGKKKARLVDIERLPNGNFTVSMVRNSGEYWFWLYDVTGAKVSEFQAQTGVRIYDIERYSTKAGTRYAVLFMNNLNAQTTKLREILRGPAKKAAYGFYLKRVDGSVLTKLQERKVFEPASMIKALHHLTALIEVRDGNARLDQDVTWYADPAHPARNPGDTDYDDDKNRCAYKADGTAITSNPYTDELGDVILRQMMRQSDNRTTDAVYNLVGRAALNATAASLDMTDSRVYHRIGCPHAAAEVPYHRNELSLRDDGRLFEAVTRAASPVLGTGAVRDAFLDLMLTGTGRFEAVVQQEATSLGKSTATANSFIANMRGGFKGGSYTSGAGTCNSKGCTKQLVRRTGGGYVALPFKDAGGAIERRGYVYGNFVDGTFSCRKGKTTYSCQSQIDKMNNAREKEFREMLRPQIRAALQTW